jgi:hypothetical protein
MKIVANLMLVGFVALMFINGVRLTFFGPRACGLVRDNIPVSIEQSVMDFHTRYGDRFNGTSPEQE